MHRKLAASRGAGGECWVRAASKGLTSVSRNEAYLEVTLGEAYLIKEKHGREGDQRWGLGNCDGNIGRHLTLVKMKE